MKRVISTIAVSLLSFGWVLAWNGLVAENWDLLNLTKWNEMVTTLNSKLSNNDIIAWDGVSLSASWSQVIINAQAGWSFPFIVDQSQINIAPNTTQDIIIQAKNIAPNSQLEINGFDGTINASYGLSPEQLFANITTGSATNSYDLIINNSWLKSNQWPSNGANLLRVIAAVLWTGPAGNYTETFESNTLGNWSNVAWLDANLTIQQWWTPSSNTWPNQASWGNYYIFAEASSPNYPNKTFGISTSYFRQAESISFDYHMFGVDMWNLEVQTLHNGTWTNVFSLNGQQQTTQASAWLNSGNIDLSWNLVEEIRFLYTSWNNYTGDMALDNITIVSK